MLNCRISLKDKFCCFVAVLAGFSCFSTLSCRESRDVGTFYLRSCETGKLVGPIKMKRGQPVPSLDKGDYFADIPTKSELAIGKCLLSTNLYESEYFDCTLSDVVSDINAMLKARLGDNTPPVRIDLQPGSELPPLLTMSITATPAYARLCDIATKTKLYIFIEQGEVVLRRRKQQDT